MDKPIANKKRPYIKLLGLATLLLCVLYLGWLIISGHSSTIYYPKKQVVIQPITLGNFTETVTSNGTVIPYKTIQIDAFEGGVVDQIYAENGTWVEKGQPLIQLSNTALSLDFMNRETQIVEQINNLRNTRILLDQNKRNIQEQLLDVSYNLKQQQEQFVRDSALYAEMVISESEYLASLNNRNYLVKKKKLLAERMVTDEKYRNSQLNRIDNSIHLMERNLDAVRKSLNQLTITSPMNGQLNSFQHELGATLTKGASIGRIDVLDSFYVTAMIDQYYLHKIKPAQKARIKLGNKQQNLIIEKVNPTVNNNQFEVHFSFSSPTNKQIRRGQSAPVKIAVSNQTTTLLIPKGAYYNTSGGQYIYLVKDNTAHKKPVQLGRQNDTHIEVLSGLSQGDLVITSPYTNFNNTDNIILEN